MVWLVFSALLDVLSTFEVRRSLVLFIIMRKRLGKKHKPLIKSLCAQGCPLVEIIT